MLIKMFWKMDLILLGIYFFGKSRFTKIKKETEE
ncbi:hypothetical protein CHY_2163 [Carboxydothermus hydrogenoformans Z-2901]|uniref:Uncharacterized protein n=1 Tax=Carboxydothermus hydrogenoformans (strain ATCC BAA-161 / DSM 6008 / Z-2901) TaxID=246194 RepID=Q3AA57_CARHZ|nr:hypothetical protein CHY_2163 [Carboxydothermus hydrogenoformans Z-2901]